MNNYKYKITKDESFYFERFKGKYVETVFLKIADGWITVKGSYRAPNIDGFAWNGVSPKFRTFGVIWGAIDFKGTKRATMFHDDCFQYADELTKIDITRYDVDQLFLRLMTLDKCKVTRFYYIMVRLFGCITY